MANVNRIPYIDVFRGLLMLLVVLGHSIGNTDDIMNKVSCLSICQPSSCFQVCAFIQRLVTTTHYCY